MAEDVVRSTSGSHSIHLINNASSYVTTIFCVTDTGSWSIQPNVLHVKELEQTGPSMPSADESQPTEAAVETVPV